ncbi:putative N-acetyltransferase HLS1-like [Ananas comosus]|uniref:Putative N-acetyltransferase HLS1-like n=1 Tax=Ananas comosus TaxID=4615 RepID=A0A199VZG5_ANACO|nr:putative N-acetyltransferase HLS1-like [Ananas comosus]
MIRVRELDMERDLAAVEELERQCEVGSSTTAIDTAGDKNTKRKKNKKKKKSISLYVDQLGDPMSRVRHAPEHIMLVAEYGEEEEIVGVIRACVKMVTRGRAPTSTKPAYVKVAYLLGLRVSPSHRRLGIATALVEHIESWSSARGAVYAYIATTAANATSLALFTGRRLSYTPFRRPLILAHPVHAHPLPLCISPRHPILRLPPPSAAALYARLLPPSTTEFLPLDLPSLLSHKLTVGSFLALSPASSSFALLSVFDSSPLLRLYAAPAPSRPMRAVLAFLRTLDSHVPWARLPSVPDVFKPFACAAVVAEVARGDPVAAAVPRWRSFSSGEDVWCMKRLGSHEEEDGDDNNDDWVASPPSSSGKVIFVDPREF